MVQRGSRFLREHAFLVAAAALPLLVIGVFLLATAIPRWTVPPPAYDLVLKATAYDPAAARSAVELTVADGTLQATVRPLPPNASPQRVTLWVFDHRTLAVRQLPLALPDLRDGEPSRTVVVDALAGQRLLAQPTAPDGYEFTARRRGSPGIVGDLFGMRRYGEAVAIVNRGRVVPVEWSSSKEYWSPIFVGWTVGDAR